MPAYTVGEVPLTEPARPATFVVDVEREYVETADRCDLWLLVRGSTFFSGHAALTQAEEVAKVVAAVVGAGVPREAVRLADVAVDAKAGVLTRSTSASYTLRVELNDLALLADVLTAATGPKTCTLIRREFRFSEDAAATDRWLAEVLADARRRAAALAAAAGVTVGPVTEITHRVTRTGADPRSREVAAAGAGDDDLIGDYTVTRGLREYLPSPVVRERRVTVEAGLRAVIGPPADAAETGG